MNFLDIIIIVPLAYAAYVGFKKGFIIAIFTLLALLIGIYAGVHFSDGLAGFVKSSLGWDSEYLPVISFTVTLLLVGAMVYFAGVLIEKAVKVVQLGLINRIAGLVFSLLKMVYILSIAFVLFESYDEKMEFFPPQTKDGSLLYQPVKNLSTQTIPGLEESTIFLKNAFQPESDSTGLSWQEIWKTKQAADSMGVTLENAQAVKEFHDENVRL